MSRVGWNTTNCCFIRDRSKLRKRRGQPDSRVERVASLIDTAPRQEKWSWGKGRWGTSVEEGHEAAECMQDWQEARTWNCRHWSCYMLVVCCESRVLQLVRNVVCQGSDGGVLWVGEMPWMSEWVKAVGRRGSGMGVLRLTRELIKTFNACLLPE